MRLAWSNRAKTELQQLRRFSIERWGREVALRYVEDVRAAANYLSVDPARAKALGGAFRIFRVRSHYLIVQLDAAADVLVIARVLHVTMDIDRHLT